MKVNAILETCLYAENLSEIEKFYTDILGLEPYSKREGRSVFFRCGEAMLLFFNPTNTSQIPVTLDNQKIPLHGTKGEGHVCFKIQKSEIPAWRNWLNAKGVEIESEVTWGNGALSIYFRDPAGNCLEVASAGLWGLPE